MRVTIPRRVLFFREMHRTDAIESVPATGPATIDANFTESSAPSTGAKPAQATRFGPSNTAMNLMKHSHPADALLSAEDM